MTNIQLKQKWTSLTERPLTSGFRSVRISADCYCELYLGISDGSNRCLILALPESKLLDFKGIHKENLTIEYYAETNLIVLQLTDISFSDLFDDLILSLYFGIRSIRHVDEYSDYFIQAFYRWNYFFEEKKSNLLSENVIKGIIGELLILKLLITSTDQPDINYLLKAWTGPYDNGNDFEFDDKNLEIKTKSPSAIDVNISSEFQLEVAPGKGLELIVVSLISDLNTGINIKDIILEIRQLIQELYGESSIFWSALRQKNITSKNMSDYDMYRFAPINWTSYNCANDEFPKLNFSNIPEEISGLKYILRTNLLTSFIIGQNDF